MTKHIAAWLLYAVGVCGILFSLARTLYLLRKRKREEANGHYQTGLMKEEQGE